jgi:hypothetical protein
MTDTENITSRQGQWRRRSELCHVCGEGGDGHA